MFLVVPPSVQVNWLVQFVQFFVNEFVPTMVSTLSSLVLAPGVSLFAFLIAVALLCLVIGGILLR